MENAWRIIFPLILHLSFQQLGNDFLNWRSYLDHHSSSQLIQIPLKKSSSPFLLNHGGFNIQELVLKEHHVWPHIPYYQREWFHKQNNSSSSCTFSWVMKKQSNVKVRNLWKGRLKEGAKKVKFLQGICVLYCSREGLNKNENKTEWEGNMFARNRKTSFELLKSCMF